MNDKLENITAIGFDADDTLWENESFYQETEHRFQRLLAHCIKPEKLSRVFFAAEMRNLKLYGFGAKSFILSMLETAVRVNPKINAGELNEIFDMGKALIDAPLLPLDGAEETLCALHAKYDLVLVTKGDLLDQARKLEKSGMKKYFSHVEILSDKTRDDYKNLLHKLNVRPENFLMVGNSLKSDILPALKTGCACAYIPFRVTWQHEKMRVPAIRSRRFFKIKSLPEISAILA
jgi:putative hydrolase of the HAD superfamily